MTFGEALRRYWQEAVLTLVLSLPWLTLLAFGIIWLWQAGHVLAWALARAALGLLAWPLRHAVKRRADAAARNALGQQSGPSSGWNDIEREAWVAVLGIADSVPPLSFTATDPIKALVRRTIEAVAHHFHPNENDPWAQFNLPDTLLLAERLCRDVRRVFDVYPPGNVHYLMVLCY